MKNFKTEKRLLKIESALRARQFSLMVVLENIHDPHNVSAILRTCDAAGVPEVSLIYTDESFPRIGKKSSASAFKWVERTKYKSVEECYCTLRKEKFSVYASLLSKESTNLFDLDLTQKVALVLGNEHRGVSKEAVSQADKSFYIPMYGMVQSLNVSVAAAIILYESLRQRLSRGMYEGTELSREEYGLLLEKWCAK